MRVRIKNILGKQVLLLSTFFHFSFIYWISICDRWSPEPFPTVASTTVALYMCGVIFLIIWESLWLSLPIYFNLVVWPMIVRTIVVIVRQLLACFNITHSIHANMRKPLVCSFYIHSIDFQICITAVPQIKWVKNLNALNKAEKPSTWYPCITHSLSPTSGCKKLSWNQSKKDYS